MGEIFRENHARGLEPNRAVSLENTHIDDQDPAYLQMLSRVNHSLGAKPQYVITLMTLLLIITFAFGAYFIRAATINALDTQQINGSPFSQTTQPSSPFTDMASSNQSPFELPVDAEQDNQQADQRAAKDITNNKVFASKLTFIILSVIFVGVQLIGILIGYFRSFAGIESRAAAGYIGNFSSSEAFTAWYARIRERIERDAQDKLVTLQSRMALSRASSGNSAFNEVRTFSDYIAGKQYDQLHAQAQQQAQLQSQTQFAAQQVAVQAPQLSPTILAQQDQSNELLSVAASQLTEAQRNSVTSSTAMPSASDKEKVRQLGDLTSFDDDDLDFMAQQAGLPLQLLKKQRKIQQALQGHQAGTSV